MFCIASVSGLHLTEANHIILLHPFYYGPGTEDKAIASEKQGIARAHRFGQTRPVKVLRFVCSDTVEGELLQQRKK
jgi:SNF2 family DNA or RNA helicase